MLRADHPRFQAALHQVEDSIDAAWRELCAATEAEPQDERQLAETVPQDPSEFDWRVVDGALKQLRCPDCGEQQGAGLLDGALPTTPQAQHFKALINKLTDDELEQLIHPDDLDKT